MSKFLAIQLIILLFSGLAICEIYRLVYWKWPQTATIEYDLFLAKNYKEKITVLWYMYELGNFINRSIWAFVLTIAAKKISYRLSKVSLVFLWYYIIESAFYIYDRNTSYFRNFTMYICMISVTILLFIPLKPTGKYRSIEQDF